MWDILYRPRKYSDVLGQEGCVRLLKTRISRGTAFDTSYIFAGGYGRGKTTLSRIHGMAMLCQDLSHTDPEPCGQCDSCKSILNEQSEAFTERDAASSGSAESMRALVEELPYALSHAPKRIYLIDECQRLHHAAQDVLLKPTEEKRLVLMLCTTEAEKIRGAIRSRCEEYTIKQVTRDDVLPRMKMILCEQGVAYEDDAVLIIIDRAEGHVRNMINNLEMVAQLGPITVQNVREYLNLSVVTLYYEILLALDNPLKAIDLVWQACELTPAAEVAAGLAEAAMNCYRMANSLFTDFSYVDKALAVQVYNKYQGHVVRFAKWFLSHRHVTRLTLEMDVLAFSQNPGNLPSEMPLPPVVLTSAAPFQVAPVLAPVPAAPTAVMAPGVAGRTGSTPAPAPSVGVCITGTPDPTPSSPLEKTISDRDSPRQRARQAVVEAPRRSRGDQRRMAPTEWCEAFERSYKKRTGRD